MIATLATLFPLAEHFRLPGRPTDFGLAWFGARSLLYGIDPYPLVGPGRVYNWDWELLYPANAMVLAIPLAWMPEIAAASVFVWVSSACLAYGVTDRSWDRLFIFPSSAFIVAVRAAQWSPLFSAAICIPWLGFVLSAKPNVGVAIGLAVYSKKATVNAIIGAVVVTAISLVLLPTWPRAWLTALSSYHPLIPLMRPGGFVILVALLRWRRPEARLILLLACVPQTGSWYEALPLLLVATTRRETQMLSLVSSLGYLLIPAFLIRGQPEAQFNAQVSALIVAFAYLPAAIVVLRRPNEGPLPGWISLFRRSSASVHTGTA